MAEEPTYVVRPMKALLVVDLFTSHINLLAMLLLGLSYYALWSVQHGRTYFYWDIRQVTLMYATAGLGIALLVLRFVMAVIGFRRTRYVFTSQGITFEGGFNFFSDFVGWQHLNDVNVTRNPFQQLLGRHCGTIQLCSLRLQNQYLLYVPQSLELGDYFKKKIAQNLQRSRGITPL